MRANTRPIASLLQVLLILGSASAFGGEGMTITINNNTTSDLLVTIYDMSTNPAQRLLSSESINGFASITVTIAADASGQGHLSWSATTLGPDMRRCGHRDKPGLSDGDTVHVFANDECATK
jgi:hypothetical protein